MIILRILLFPFSILYNLITGVRNRLYDLGLKPSVKFDVPVINVGNLAVGGTGKTPMVEHLIRLLAKDYKLATLSRGYGRKTKGIRIANPDDRAETVGDEPYQFYKKFNDEIVVAVGEERTLAIPTILAEREKTQVILMDDAYQHRKVVPMLNILLTDYNRLFYKDFLLPAGRLRESRSGAHRAHAIVITKCPSEISDDEMMDIEKSVRRYVHSPLFFSTIRYGSPQSFGGDRKGLGDQVILVSGIASDTLLKTYVSTNFKMVKHFAFKDHHSYSRIDMDQLLEAAKKFGASILTTEKDMVKMNINEFSDITSQIPFFYLPIEVEFIKNGKDFDALVQTALSSVHK